MKEKRVKKVPGWSYIELQNHLHAFNAGSHLHTRNQDIHHMLRMLMGNIADLEIFCDFENIVDDSSFSMIVRLYILTC